MRRSNVIGFFFLFFSVPAMAQDSTGKTYSLKQCVEIAIGQNIDVTQKGSQVQANDAILKQSRLEMLPNLNGSVGHGINQGRSIDPFTNGYINERIDVANYNLSSELVLFNGLSIRNAVKKNAIDYEASKMSWQQVKDEITIKVILAYLGVMTNQELIVQGEKQVDLTGKQVQRLEILNNNGSIKPSDLYDLKGQLSADQIALISTRNALETAKIDLCTLMNIRYDKNIKLENFNAEAIASAYPDMPTDIYNKALADFAMIRYAELQTKSAQKAVKIYQGRLFPTLTFNGNASSNYSSAASQNIFINTTDVPTNDYVVISGTPTQVIHPQSNYRFDKIAYAKQLNNNISTYISINLRVPLFNGLRARNQVKLAKIDAKNYSLLEQSAKTGLQQSVEKSYLDMSTVYDRYKTLLDQVNSYQQSFRAAEIRFNEGVGTSIDYLTARTNYDRASNNLIIARYEYIVRTKILDYYQGKLSW